MIEEVDREMGIAVPLKVGTAMAAEVVGGCVLTGILDLVFNKSLLYSESQRVLSTALSTSNDVKIVVDTNVTE